MKVQFKDFSFEKVNECTCTLMYTVEYPESIEVPYINKTISGSHICDLLDIPFSDFIHFINDKIRISEELYVLSDQLQKNMNMKFGGKSLSSEVVQELGDNSRELVGK